MEVPMKRILILSAAIIIALPAASSKPRISDAERLEKALAGRTAGKPMSCVSLRDLSGSEVIGDDIIYRVNRTLLYRNQSSGGCESARRGDALVTRTYSSRLCQGDIVRTADLQAGFESGSCVLGKFTPYRKDRNSKDQAL
jgi:hypothetical protein